MTECIQIRQKATHSMILKVTLALLSWSAVTLAKPQGGQLVQPEWNWQEVGGAQTKYYH